MLAFDVLESVQYSVTCKLH